MKVALVQMEVVLGQPEKNVQKMLENIEQAKEQNVDLIAFPEMCVGGYLLGDDWLSDEFCLDMMEFNDEIKKASNGIAVAFGNIFLDNNLNKRIGTNEWHPNKDGRVRRYNAAYIYQNGKPARRARETILLPKGIQPKTHLPNYRIFDDKRYFFPLKEIAIDFGEKLEDLTQPFILDDNGREVKVGFDLCEGLWCADYRRNKESLNPSKYLIQNGAELIINLSASPWTYGKNGARDRRVEFLKKDCGLFVPFYYVNCTGAQNNGKNIVTFDGGSTVYNKEGKPTHFSKGAYLEELLVVENGDYESKTRVEKPKIAQKLDAIIAGIRHAKDMMGMDKQPKYVIGMSGGIDSTIVAALLTLAVGKDNVLGVNMPGDYNSEKTKNAAAYTAKKLGIAYTVIPIKKLVTANEELLENLDIDDNAKLSSLNKENIQAKIRGTNILSNLAAKYGAIFTNNGNKLEVALGYATLYGDVGGGKAPIADLTKAEIFELARYLNKEVFKDEVIPEVLIPDELFRFREDQIEPSAELKDKQVDPMKFGYHCALIDAITDYKKKTMTDIMKWYIAGTMEKNLGISTALLERWNIDNPEEFVKDLEWFYSKIRKNVFKRVQSPPITITSKSAYGYDIRESLFAFRKTKSYERLKEKVLAMKEYKTKI